MIMSRYLGEHAAEINDPARAGYAVQSIEAFIAHQRSAGAIDGVLSAAAIGLDFVRDFAAYRRAGGVADATIKRELGVLKASFNWAGDNQILASVPRIPKLTGKAVKLRTQPRKLAYNLPQLAAFLEAAWIEPRRRHVHLFGVAMLASHSRVEAITECDLDLQYVDGVIDWLGSEEQTKKRRAMTPAGPTLASWLEGRKGKLIREITWVEKAKRKDPDKPELGEFDVWSIRRAYNSTLIAAGERHPGLKLRRPLVGPDGEQLVKVVNRTGDGRRCAPREVPLWEGIGSPNTLRHSVHTQLKRIGVRKELIDAASGHAEQGTGENYNHFDALHDLKEFTAGVEQLFDELRHYTTVHIRSQDGPKVFDLSAVRAAKAG
jgi:integrase